MGHMVGFPNLCFLEILKAVYRRFPPVNKALISDHIFEFKLEGLLSFTSNVIAVKQMNVSFNKKV